MFTFPNSLNLYLKTPLVPGPETPARAARKSVLPQAQIHGSRGRSFPKHARIAFPGGAPGPTAHEPRSCGFVEAG